ncbi:gag/pol polyprotein, partial [Tanacetum coccineum]
GQPSPVSTTSIPIPTPPPPPPPITRQRLENVRQNPKQRVPYNPSANHATVLPTTITERTGFTIDNIRALLIHNDQTIKISTSSGFFTICYLSQPDIAFAVNKACQYMHASTENHWSAVKRILCYLHGTVEHGMLIRRSSGSTLQAFTNVLWKGNPDTSLKAFLDADWVGDSDDRRSTREFAIYLGSNLISWTSRKQRTISRSSTEAEYKAFADTVAELTWLQAPLNELGIRSSSTPILWCDNLGATYLSANPIFHARTKHVKIDYHFVREKVAQGDLRVQHISTHDQIADIFTKPLPTPRFFFLRSKLQVVARP